MNELQKKTAILSITLLLVCAISLSFIGYGEGHIAMLSKSAQLTQNATAPTHTSVIYERQYLGKSDLLHLEIDTTYHTRGKKGYCYEIVCNDEVSLRSFDHGYLALKISKDICFVEGSERNLLKTSNKQAIENYPCDHAIFSSNDTSWEIWYCDALPHRPNVERLSSRYKGLILAACNGDKTYTLKAKYISHNYITN